MIDSKIISAYQWIVDESERQPAWWVEQTAWAYIAAEIAGAALSWDGGWSIFSLVITLGVGSIMLLLARNPRHMNMAAASAAPYRLLFLGLVVYFVVTLYFKPDAARAADLFSTIMLMSSHYFCACEPPRPRKRRQSVAQGGAA